MTDLNIKYLRELEFSIIETLNIVPSAYIFECTTD